jgi:hypothetical protein
VIPGGTDFTVTIAKPRRPGEPWQDAERRWWTPGKRGPDGTIVSGTPGQFISCGLVLVRDEDTQDLAKDGWRIAPIAPTSPPSGLIYVQR